MKACRIINIKLGRVAGFSDAKTIHDMAQAAGIPVWCGGMLESGIGRAHNVALSTLPNFVLPGDVSASRRYWKQDVIRPEVEVTSRGTICITDEPGFGYAPDLEQIRRITVREETVVV
jgi:O-succinylbenzoate synthase